MDGTLSKCRTKVLGTITIGQSPRPDLIPELRKAMGLGDHENAGDAVRIAEGGALDGLTLDEVNELAPHAGDYVLVTRMADGTAVKIAERHILPRMQAQIDRLVANGADVIALVCTGEFPKFSCDRLLVEPQKVLRHAAAAVASGRRLGVLLPDKDQIPQGTRRWSSLQAFAGYQGYESDHISDHSLRHSPSGKRDQHLRIEAASPYGDPTSIRDAAERLREWGVEMVVMDCIGYTLAMKGVVKEVIGVPVILARSILGRTLAELLE